MVSCKFMKKENYKAETRKGKEEKREREATLTTS